MGFTTKQFDRTTTCLYLTIFFFSLTLVVSFYHEARLRSLLSSKNDIAKEYQEKFQQSVEKIEKDFFLAVDMEILFHRPSKYQLIWHNFVLNEPELNQTLASLPSLKSGNDNLKAILASKSTNNLRLPIYIGSAIIIFTLIFEIIKKRNNFYRFENNKLNETDRMLFGLSDSLDLEQQNELSQLFNFLLSTDEILTRLFKSKAVSSKRLKTLKVLVENVFLDMQNIGVLQLDLELPEKTLLQRAEKLFTRSLEAERKKAYLEVQKGTKKLERESAKLEVERQRIQAEISRGIKDEVNNKKSQISILLDQIQGLKKVVKKWKSWKKNQREEKIRLSNWARKLEEKESQLSSDWLLLESKKREFKSRRDK